MTEVECAKCGEKFEYLVDLGYCEDCYHLIIDEENKKESD